MTFAQWIDQLAQTAKHNPAGLAEVDMRALLLQVSARLDLLEQCKYAHQITIVRDEETPEYARVTIDFTLGPDTLATLLEVVAE